MLLDTLEKLRRLRESPAPQPAPHVPEAAAETVERPCSIDQDDLQPVNLIRDEHDPAVVEYLRGLPGSLPNWMKPTPSALSRKQMANLPHHATGDDNMAFLPDGWTLESWRERLVFLERACKPINPVRAVQLRKWISALVGFPNRAVRCEFEQAGKSKGPP